MNLFFELLQVSLGTRDFLSRVPSGSEWNSILKEAQKQTVFGVLAGGLERLPHSQYPEKALLLQWIGLTHLNEGTYLLHCARIKQLTTLLRGAGFRSSVLKGVGQAQYYPHPEHRQCGDIDLWVEARTKDVLTFLKGKYQMDYIFWHHADAKIFDDVATEIHYHPGWMYNPFCNLRLQRWFDKVADEQMVVDEKLGFASPTPQFNAVYSLVHSLHHLIEEGLGFRHVVDYFYVLKSLPASDKVMVEDELKQFGLLKFAGAMMWLMREVCGLGKDFLLCEPNEKEGRFLLEEIFSGGNFGQYRKDGRTRNTLSRMLAVFPHYPREVLWVVPWKVWHKGWRFLNRDCRLMVSHTPTG